MAMFSSLTLHLYSYNQNAITYINRALDLTPETTWALRYEMLIILENVYGILGDRENQQNTLTRLINITQNHLLDAAKQAEVMKRQADYYRRTGAYTEAIDTIQQLLRFDYINPNLEGELYDLWGRVLVHQSNFSEARTIMNKALALAKSTHNVREEARCLNTLGDIYYLQEQFQLALNHFEETLSIYQQIQYREGLPHVLNMLAAVHGKFNRYGQAQSYYNQAIKAMEAVGDRYAQTDLLSNLASHSFLLGDLDNAQTCYKQALDISQEIDDRGGEALNFSGLGLINYTKGHYSEAIASLTKAIDIQLAIESKYGIAYSQTYLGYTYVALSKWDEAKIAHQKAVSLRTEQNQTSSMVDNWAELAYIAWQQNNPVEIINQMERILAHIQDNGFIGIEFPAKVLLTCYHIITNLDTSHTFPLTAQTLLSDGYLYLEEQMAQFVDSKTHRQQFVTNLPWRSELITLWQANYHD